MALDELLDGNRVLAVETVAGQGLLQLPRCIDSHGAGRAGAAARFQDQREADLLGERPHRRGGFGAGRLRAGNAGLAQRGLHRWFVAAQPGRAHAGARNTARFPDAGDGQNMRLDRGLDAVHPQAALGRAHGLQQGGFIDNRFHLLVLHEPVPKLRVERSRWPLADADHRRPGCVQRTHEFPLVLRKPGLDENHVHAAISLA